MPTVTRCSAVGMLFSDTRFFVVGIYVVLWAFMIAERTRIHQFNSNRDDVRSFVASRLQAQQKQDQKIQTEQQPNVSGFDWSPGVRSSNHGDGLGLGFTVSEVPCDLGVAEATNPTFGTSLLQHQITSDELYDNQTSPTYEYFNINCVTANLKPKENTNQKETSSSSFGETFVSSKSNSSGNIEPVIGDKIKIKCTIDFDKGLQVISFPNLEKNNAMRINEDRIESVAISTTTNANTKMNFDFNTHVLVYSGFQEKAKCLLEKFYDCMVTTPLPDKTVVLITTTMTTTTKTRINTPATKVTQIIMEIVAMTATIRTTTAMEIIAVMKTAIMMTSIE